MCEIIFSKYTANCRTHLNLPLKLLVCSLVPDNLSIGSSVELCMKVLLNRITAPLVCIFPHRQVDSS